MLCLVIALVVSLLAMPGAAFASVAVKPTIPSSARALVGISSRFFSSTNQTEKECVLDSLCEVREVGEADLQKVEDEFLAFRRKACVELAMAEGRKVTNNFGKREYPCFDTEEPSSGAWDLDCCTRDYPVSRFVRHRENEQYFRQACQSCKHWAKRGDWCSRPY